MKWHVSINNVLDHLVTSAFLNQTVKTKCVHSDPITNWLRTAACMNVSCWSARRERVSMWTTTTRGANTQCRNVEAEQLRHKNVSCLLINTELIQQRRVGERARKEAEKNGERWTSRLNGSSNTTETGAIQREHWSSELEVKRFPVTGRGYRLKASQSTANWSRGETAEDLGGLPPQPPTSCRPTRMNRELFTPCERAHLLITTQVYIFVPAAYSLRCYTRRLLWRFAFYCSWNQKTLAEDVSRPYGSDPNSARDL